MTSESQYVRNETYLDVNVSTTAYTDTGYLPEGIQTSSDDSESNETAERTAVVNVGGFYISRYEAGNDGSNNLISKKDVAIYNNISQENSKEKAKTFINNKNVKSALCSGIQWDAMMSFLTGKDETYDVTSFNSDRHKNVKANSGENDIDKICNIYDLEGNFWEYVAEKSSNDINNIFVGRGGGYNSTLEYTASDRHTNKGVEAGGTSFRFVLYVM